MSQQIIQKELEVPCIHFACPWGKVGLDFEPFTTKPLAEKSGYKTFATTNRGKMIQGDDLFQIKRDHVLAGWENYQLKFFFGS